MKQKLIENIKVMNHRLDDFENLLTGDEKWHESDSQEEWSGDELLLHLYLTEKFTLSYLKKKIAENKVNTSSSWTSFFRSYFLLRFLRSSRKALSPKIVNPRLYPETKSRALVMKDFRGIRADWIRFIEERKADYWKGDVFKHPYAGPLKGTQMMDFLLTHFERHLSQFKGRQHQ